MEWDDELVLAFINEYKTHSVLWDTTYKYYKAIQKKRSAWAAISKKMNVDVAELRRKINSLLASYRKVRQKLDTNNSGTGNDEVYNTSWFAYDAFSFLHDRYRPKPTKFTLEHASITTAEVSTKDNIQSNGIKIEEMSSFEEQESKQAAAEAASDTRDEGHEELTTCVSPRGEPTRKRLKVNQNPRIEEAYNIFETVTNKKRDEFEAYGEYIAVKLRQFDKRTCAYVQRAFGEILFEAELGEYKAPHQDRSSSRLSIYSPSFIEPYANLHPSSNPRLITSASPAHT